MYIVFDKINGLIIVSDPELLKTLMIIYAVSLNACGEAIMVE